MSTKRKFKFNKGDIVTYLYDAGYAQVGADVNNLTVGEKYVVMDAIEGSILIIEDNGKPHWWVHTNYELFKKL